jgi:SHS2 domain-containing protein
MIPFEIYEHPAGTGLLARGAALPDLFQNAALGLMSWLVDLSTVRPGGIRDRVRAQAPEAETLLSLWLNEILFLYKVQQMVFCRFPIRRFGGAGQGVWFIEAEGEGELLDPGRHSVMRRAEAAAFHGLTLQKTEAGWQARLLFDK